MRRDGRWSAPLQRHGGHKLPHRDVLASSAGRGYKDEQSLGVVLHGGSSHILAPRQRENYFDRGNRPDIGAINQFIVLSL